MKDKEKQIEEMAKVIRPILENRTDIGFIPDLDKPITEELVKYYQPKLPEDSVVLSREEYERLSSSHDIVFCDNKDCPDNLLCRCAEISECPKNIPKYNEKLSANKHKLELFQKLGKERERADSWEDRYKLLEQELKQSSKETAEKAFEITKRIIDKKYAIETPSTRVTLSNIINQIEKEFAKQFGFEIKE